MARVLIPYGTSEGQTAKVAAVIAEVMRERGHEAECVDVGGLTDHALDDHDGAIVGASIHMGKHDKHVARFVERNRDVLERLPSAFFSVSLAAHGDPEEARRYVQEFEDGTGWRPDLVAMFSGALLYTQYGFVKRTVMKKIARDKPGNLGVDTSRDYVYTEWDAVKRFAEHCADQVERASA